MAAKTDVTKRQGELVAVMAQEKGVLRAEFQSALTDGRFSTFLDGLIPAEKPKIVAPVPVQTVFLEIVLEPGKTLEEMFEAGRYNDLNPNINSTNFPGEGTENLSEPARMRIRFDNFGRRVSEAEREAFFAQPGRVPATPTDAAAVGVQHPDFQRTHLCAFTSKFRLSSGGYRGFVCLDGGAAGRGAGLNWVGPRGRWHGFWWFSSREVIL